MCVSYLYFESSRVSAGLSSGSFTLGFRSAIFDIFEKGSMPSAVVILLQRSIVIHCEGIHKGWLLENLDS